MSAFDSTITALVLLPFSALVLYYFAVIMGRTLQDWEKPTGWKARARLTGIVLLQIFAVVSFVLWIYFVVRIKFLG